MKTPASGRYTVTVDQINGLGTTWIVRVHKKVLLFKRQVTSDWFLDGDQARRFAEQLKGELNAGDGLHGIISRKPGWTLHRSSH